MAQRTTVKSGHSLKRGSDVGYVVQGGDEFRVYTMQVLGHDGDFTVSKGKVSSGENFADGFIPTGFKYVTDVPHGDVGQGNTWVWLDEVPAGFYIG